MSEKTMMTPDMNAAAHRRRGRRRVGALLLGGTLLTAGCDLEVISPSHLSDEALDNPAIVLALLRGAEGDFARAAAGEAGFGGLYVHGALLTDELVHSGIRTAARLHSEGETADHLLETNELWAAASQARFTSEELVKRIDRLLPLHADSVELTDELNSRLAAGLVWAGMSNRLMGDHFCHAVIDGGPLQDHKEYYRRAEAYFTRAIQLFTEVVAAEEDEAGLIGALGGRAHVRMMLGDWQGAVQDAGRVRIPGGMVHRHAYYVGRQREWNFIMQNSLFANREITVWGTPFAEWGRNLSVPVSQRTGDPRISWDKPSSVPLGTDERRPFWRQRKHTSSGGSVGLSSWNEMRLIEAEARLVAGDWAGAVDKINEVRAQHNSPPTTAANRVPLVSAGSADEAWALLMRERGIVLWLEGRRLADMRRWSQQPGFVPTSVVREAGAGDAETDVVRPVLDIRDSFCIPVSSDERRSNPNI